MKNGNDVLKRSPEIVIIFRVQMTSSWYNRLACWAIGVSAREINKIKISQRWYLRNSGTISQRSSLFLRVQSLIEIVMYFIMDNCHGDCTCKIEVPSLRRWFKSGEQSPWRSYLNFSSVISGRSYLNFSSTISMGYNGRWYLVFSRSISSRWYLFKFPSFFTS